MARSRRSPLTLALALLGLLVAACAAGGGSSTPARPPARQLTVLAAASLREAFFALGTAYERAVPGTVLTFSFDASSTLRAQIEQGAPVDAFASADLANAQAIVADGLAAGPLVPFAANGLVIVVPDTNPARIMTALDLARPGVTVVAAGDNVPISGYALEVLARLATQPGYPGDYAVRVAANVISKEDNVRAVLAKVELGEADAALVYVTDAASSSRVDTIAIPAAAQVTATYVAVSTSASREPAAAAAFVEWLAGPDSAAILAGFGFLPPRAP